MSETLYIDATSDIQKVELYNILGKKVMESVHTDQINVNHFSAGIYLLKIKTEKGNLTKKIIIE